jgi:acyl-CoA thioester hydrolase
MSYNITFQTKWSDFDANKHMRHTAYNDYAAEARLRFLNDFGFGLSVMEAYNIGPILFSENTIFRREIRLGEDIIVKLFLEASSKHGERFKIRSLLYRKDGELAATISIYLAWIDLSKRKLTIPSSEIIETLKNLEKTDDFEDIIITKKE